MANSFAGALVIDASVIIAIAAKEAGRDFVATNEIARYADIGYGWHVPNIGISETLFILCGKKAAKILSPTEYDTAIETFDTLMTNVLSPTDGDKRFIKRAVQIGNGYGCSRSADALYIALAEELSMTMPTVLLTFDQELPKQAARNAPTVTVQVL